MTFTCPECGMTSHNPNDIREQYCGNCHEFTGVPYIVDVELPDDPST